jgi:large subunit ribosomal protein L15
MVLLQKLSHQFSRLLSLQNALPREVTRSLSTAAAAPLQPQVVTFLRLNNLQDNPGAVKKGRRIGRGIGSSKGKTSGRGHKGQKARSGGSIHPTFEGGQTKFYKLLPKRGFNNAEHAAPMIPLNLGTLQMYVDMGRLDPAKEITMRDMQLAGLFKANGVKHGVKLLADGALKQPLDLHVSRASSSAIAAVEAAGGSVTSVHYNQLALRALLRPQKFEVIPKRARPPPKWQPYYTNMKNRGYLNPGVQMRDWFKKNPELEDKFDTIWAKNHPVKEEEDSSTNE